MVGDLVEWLESALSVAVSDARTRQLRDALDVEAERARRRVAVFDRIAGVLASERGLVFERARMATERAHRVILWSPSKDRLFDEYTVADAVFDDDQNLLKGLRAFSDRLVRS
jgi:hypothetical protein